MRDGGFHVRELARRMRVAVEREQTLRGNRALRELVIDVLPRRIPVDLDRDARLLRRREYAIPTEDQWEYACRAGTTTRWFFGNDPAQMKEFGWTAPHAQYGNHPVGQLAANPFGEHDFYHDPKRDGSVTILPGSSLTFRYRIILHPWDVAEAKIAEQYKKWVEKVQ